MLVLGFWFSGATLTGTNYTEIRTRPHFWRSHKILMNTFILLKCQFIVPELPGYLQYHLPDLPLRWNTASPDTFMGIQAACPTTFFRREEMRPPRWWLWPLYSVQGWWTGWIKHIVSVNPQVQFHNHGKVSTCFQGAKGISAPEISMQVLYTI